MTDKLLSVEMTGKEDMESPWKLAFCGFAGAGKTLLASTADDPLFVFFQENPRLKSIADRYVPHVKVVNDDKGTVMEKMLALTHHLALGQHDYRTLVLDTGDELLQGMKEARRLQNEGEFRPGDWDWLGDTYREVVTGLIDLPMRVIVLFHVKNAQEGEDGMMVRELLLQGAAKDQAPGWFDLVAMLDAFEVVDDEGNTHTRRGLLTHSSRLHPWVKDHSGQLPRRYELTDDFIGDIAAIEKAMTKEVKGEKFEVEEITSDEPSEPTTDEPVVTPEVLDAKKHGETTTADTHTSETETTTSEMPELEKAKETVQQVLEATEVEEEPSDSGAASIEAEAEETPPEPVTTADLTEPSDEEPEEVGFSCEECGETVDNDDLINMSRAKYKAVLCRPHFKARMRGTN